jgi:uncharacterized protein with HEPN domain
LDGSRRDLQQLGEAASHLSPERRARLPGISWARLDLLRSVHAVEVMGARELWAFIHHEVLAISRALG